MEAKSRIRNLTTRYFLIYKYGILGVIVLLFLFAMIYIITRWNEIRIAGYWVILAISPLVFILNWIRLRNKVFRLEYDDDFLYVFQEAQDIVIPLENIRDVYISEKGGMWEINLYNPETFGKKLHFTPSLLYPIGFRKAEERIHAFQRSIKKAKQKLPDIQKNALHS